MAESLALPELPAAIASRATIGPDGHRWIAYTVPENMAADEVQAGDAVLADLDRAGLEDGGPYLIILEWGDGSVTTAATHLDEPLRTNRGEVRGRLYMRPIGPVLERARLGSFWWPVRVRQRVRVIPLTVRGERDLERPAAAGADRGDPP